MLYRSHADLSSLFTLILKYCCKYMTSVTTSEASLQKNTGLLLSEVFIVKYG